MQNSEEKAQIKPNYPPFACFNNPLSKDMTRDILNGETYKHVKFIKDVKVIIDIGANIGASAVYFSRIYPDAQLYAFEPSNAPYNLLQQNIQSYKNIKSYKIGLYSENKEVPLYGGQVDSATGSIGKSLYNSEITETVILKDVKETFNELNISPIDILKVDTEGCEVPILTSLQESYLSEIKIIYVEYHSEKDRKMIDKILENTHVLFCGKSTFFHRGDFCYVNKSVFESEEHFMSYSITIN